MSTETIKCRECGATDVVEFKPGSFVCRHCDATFKQVTSAGIAAVCGIDSCGVLAVGRCHRCGRAFCATHQRITSVMTYTNLCDPCGKSHQAQKDNAWSQAFNAAEEERRAKPRADAAHLDKLPRMTANELGRAVRSNMRRWRLFGYARPGSTGLFPLRGWGIWDEYFVSRSGHVYEVDSSKRPYRVSRRIPPNEPMKYPVGHAPHADSSPLWGRGIDAPR
jgi:hypothetical protein